MKKKKKRVLVLESGGPCGISAIKLLKKNDITFVVAADIDTYSPSFSMADVGIIVPPAGSPEFASTIQSILNEYLIDIVLPTFEHGYKSLSSLNNKAFVTDFKSALACKDKLKFHSLCKKKGLPTPDTKLMSDVSKIDGSVYIKPRVGVGSRNNYPIENDAQYQKLKNYITHHNKYIVQDLLKGDHWNIDVLVEDGSFKRAIPRRDLKQKEGNCITVSIKRYKKLIEFSKQVQKKLFIQSPFNLEVFDNNGNFTINEVNVRFGGGVIFGALAGVDIVSYLVTKDENFLGILKEKVYSRYYEEIEVKNYIK